MKSNIKLSSRSNDRIIDGSRLRKWTSLGAMTLCLAVATGCGGGGDEDVVPETGAGGSDASTGAKLDASTFNMQQLLEHENPIIANNAKPLNSAFAANNYAQASQALLMMASVGDVDSTTQGNIAKALRQVRDVASAAAAAGDPNAQYALDRLNEVFGN